MVSHCLYYELYIFMQLVANNLKHLGHIMTKPVFRRCVFDDLASLYILNPKSKDKLAYHAYCKSIQPVQNKYLDQAMYMSRLVCISIEDASHNMRKRLTKSNRLFWVGHVCLKWWNVSKISSCSQQSLIKLRKLFCT